MELAQNSKKKKKKCLGFAVSWVLGVFLGKRSAVKYLKNFQDDERGIHY